MQQSSASFGGGGRPQLNNEELAELSPGSEVNQSYVAPQLADANPTNPKLLVSNFQMQPHLAQAIASRFKITQFYPIQAECFQPIVDKKDILGRSQTGTGQLETSSKQFNSIAELRMHCFFTELTLRDRTSEFEFSSQFNPLSRTFLSHTVSLTQSSASHAL